MPNQNRAGDQTDSSSSNKKKSGVPMLLTVLVGLIAIGAGSVFVFLRQMEQQQADKQLPPLDHGTGSMFDLIATRYDLINRALALGMDTSWRRVMARKIKESLKTEMEASSSSNIQILDLATGTADVALLLAQEIGPPVSVLGVDPSSNMLSIGRQKVAARHQEHRIELRVADARQLTTDLNNQATSSSFDAATMAFGIRNVPPGAERMQALCQIHNVLKPTARFCILEFSEPDDSFGVLGLAARWFIRNVVPVLGGILSGQYTEYMHLQNSIKEFPSPQEFVQQLESLHCFDVKDDKQEGFFALEELVQMNFGSVQLYVLKRMQRLTQVAIDERVAEEEEQATFLNNELEEEEIMNRKMKTETSKPIEKENNLYPQKNKEATNDKQQEVETDLSEMIEEKEKASTNDESSDPDDAKNDASSNSESSGASSEESTEPTDPGKKVDDVQKEGIETASSEAASDPSVELENEGTLGEEKKVDEPVEGNTLKVEEKSDTVDDEAAEPAKNA